MSHIVLFRRDLRIHDNPTLAEAINRDGEVYPVYIFDPFWFDKGMFDIDRIGRYRAKFLRESVENLKSNLQEIGSDLIVRSGDTVEELETIIDSVEAENLHYQRLVGPQEQSIEAGIEELEIETNSFWTNTLYHADDLPTPYSNIDDTFTPWRKSVQYEAEVREAVQPPNEINTIEDTRIGKIPDLQKFNVTSSDPDDKTAIDYVGGEDAALNRVNKYIWEDDRLREYKETRNGLLGEEYSSKFSPWLAHGCISPRRIYEEVKEYEEKRVSNDSTYWLIFELMWRDFFKFQFMKYGSEFFGPTGIRQIERNWNTDIEAFRLWSKGRTGIPFVDANMTELNETGFMSNRGRQNVASFLVDVLNIDWRLGAMYFQSKLVDYDVSSNWGNWAYQAGVGNDSRDDRYFNVIKQGKRYDNNGEYIRYWLPELSKLPADATHEPWKMSEGQQSMFGVELGSDYPSPIVDVRNKDYSTLVDN